MLIVSTMYNSSVNQPCPFTVTNDLESADKTFYEKRTPCFKLLGIRVMSSRGALSLCGKNRKTSGTKVIDS